MFTNIISVMKRKLKLETKKLLSGKYQVKFYILDGSDTDQYGYVLAEPDTTLKEVVHKIQDGLVLKNEYNYLNLVERQRSSEILFF